MPSDMGTPNRRQKTPNTAVSLATRRSAHKATPTARYGMTFHRGDHRFAQRLARGAAPGPGFVSSVSIGHFAGQRPHERPIAPVNTIVVIASLASIGGVTKVCDRFYIHGISGAWAING